MSADQSGSSEKRASSRLTFWGLWGTAIYIAMLIAGIWLGTAKGWISWGSSVTPNELGDLLAGLFGPLAIIWVVLGFLQQGSELRLQVAELAASVEQQRDMVAVSRETLEHAREAFFAEQEASRLKYSPNLRVSLGRTSTSHTRPLPEGGVEKAYRYSLNVENRGAKLFDLTFSLQPAPEKLPNNRTPFLDSAGKSSYSILYQEWGEAIPETLEIRCISEDKTKYRLIYEVRLDGYFADPEVSAVL